MKSFVLLLCLHVVVLAQAPDPQGQKPVSRGNVASINIDGGQIGPPRADTVIATVNGKKLTYGEFQTLVRALPPQMQQNAMQNKKAFINQFALMRKLADIAEESKLDQLSPYKDLLAFSRMQVMAQAQINEAPKKFLVQPDE
ncbi:MAG: hypothetical protein HYX25_03810, partial [Candidatus Solibacter usitatus]|nr:hypothetical protein [Candidatus Solibacter usitatus]